MNHKRFDDIDHTPLRVFNRTMLATNLTGDFGPVAAEEYLQSFDKGEQKQIAIMLSYIEKLGFEKVRKMAVTGLKLADEDSLGLEGTA